MGGISLERVSKVFPGGVVAVDDIELDIGDGEFIVLVGPSGCGKSTLLRMIAGLEEITSGEIRIGAKRVTDLPPKERDIAMVFQNYALYPHMSVYQNMAFGLKLRKTDKGTIDTRVREAALAELPGAEPVRGAAPPVAGALMLALDRAGVADGSGLPLTVADERSARWAASASSA